MTTGEKLLKLKKEYGVNLAHFGDLIGVSRNTISLYARGEREISKEKEEQIERYIEEHYKL